MTEITTNTSTREHLPQPSRGGTATGRWRCEICGFVYDEARGLPHEGISPGTAWADVPESWTCPDCGVSKADFSMAPDTGRD